MVLVVDVAWSPPSTDLHRDAWLDTLMPHGIPCVHVHVDDDTEPTVALRAQWIVRSFEFDEARPFAVVLAPTPRPPGLAPLYAMPWLPTQAALVDRDEQLAVWSRDRAEAQKSAAARRRAIARSARHGWYARPDLPRVFEEGLTAIKVAVGLNWAGTTPFPGPACPATIALLLASARRGDREAAALADAALTRIAISGLRDHLGGGFFHDLGDGISRTPDFARTATENAALLDLFSAAAVELDRPDFAEVAREIAGFLLGTLRDPASRLFCCRQAADDAYYTWSTREVMAVVPFDRVNVACLHFDIQPGGGPLADPGKNVLYVAMNADELAPYIGESPEVAAIQVNEAKAAMAEARASRPAPSLDRISYVNVNALVVAALLAGAARLDEPSWTEAALGSLEALRQRCQASGRWVVPHRLDRPAADQEHHLADYAALGRALLAAFEATGGRHFLDNAVALAPTLSETFCEPSSGALLDVPRSALVSRAFWLEQAFEDTAGPSPAALAVQFLLDLHRCSGEPTALDTAANSLRAGAKAALDDPPAAAGYFLAVDQLLHIS